MRAGSILILTALTVCGCGEQRRQNSSMQSADEGTRSVQMRHSSDAYVIRAGDLTLYVPAGWMAAEAFAGTVAPTDSLEPLIRPGEAPGLLHDLKRGHRGIDLNIGKPDLRSPIFKLVLHKAGSVTSTDATRISGPADDEGWVQFGKGNGFVDTNGGPPVTSPLLASVRNGHPPIEDFPNESWVTVRQLRVGYLWHERDAPQPEWRSLPPRVVKLVDWLATDPRRRPSQPSF